MWSCFCVLLLYRSLLSCFFFFNDTATTEIYTLSLHDALPICALAGIRKDDNFYDVADLASGIDRQFHASRARRSEEHTSELQSPCNLVCRLLLEKKKKTQHRRTARSRPAHRTPRHSARTQAQH